MIVPTVCAVWKWLHIEKKNISAQHILKPWMTKLIVSDSQNSEIVSAQHQE